MGSTTRRAPPLRVFAAASALLHAGAFAAVGRPRATPPSLAFDPESQTLAGDTLLVDVPAPPAADPAAVEAPPTARPDAPGQPPPGPTRSTASASRTSAATSSAPAPAPAAVFGAVGERFATDLATAFTRAFPQAASADPTWPLAPFGPAGQAELSLTLDDDGHLTGSAVSGTPSLALRRSVERTLSLLAPRAFTARGALTRLRVRAHVSRDDVHDGLHGDVFALSAGSFSGDVGAAFFALPPGAGPGRRVDIEVRLLP
ncbi:MAG TPA: hypothetical protein VE987_15385 [Polyangiaceae bacterium]|nr:hypothetical protein [Polyangiaceae bacterium]